MSAKLAITLSLLFLLNISIGTSKASLTRGKPVSMTGLPLLNAYASRSGNVHLHQDSYGYYAYADFQYNYSEDSDSSDVVLDDNSGAMIIGLYTSQTWLINNNCMDFTSYNCEANSCSAYSWWKEASETLPYFKADGYYASANVYLDYNNWSLSPYAALTNSCISQANSYYGYGRTGVLGMGLANSSNDNFHSSPIFSIYLDKSNSTGQLQFENDQTKISTENTNTYTLTADNNWHFDLGYAFFYFEGTSTVYDLYMTGTSMIFDLDYPSIGIPYNYYSNFLSYFTEAMGVSCSTDESYPTCYYYGEIGSLPPVYLYAQGQYINIPPQVYVVGATAYDTTTSLSTFSLNVRALSSSLYDANYVTEDYDNTIIMGSSFMTYYYTVFQGSGTPSVTLYIAATPAPTPVPPVPSDDIVSDIILATIGFVAFIICFSLCIYQTCKPKRNITHNKVVPTVFAEPSAQAPLIYNAEGMNAAYTQIPPAYGSYPYGAYPQQPVGNMPSYNYPQVGVAAYGGQPQGQYGNVPNPYNPYQGGFGQEQRN